MKIIATTCARNEERNIARFVRAYKGWADSILVADGGSDDDTVSIAEWEGAQVREFSDRVEYGGDIWRNPVGPHVNFLIDWATDEGADWIIFDDCDCTPNGWLQKNARWILTEAEKPVVLAVRLYLWGEEQHFPEMAQPWKDGKWVPSLWAWRPEVGLRAQDDRVWHIAYNMVFPADGRHTELYPPYALLHRPWPDELEVARKTAWRAAMGQPFNHPIKFAGPLKPLPEWARG